MMDEGIVIETNLSVTKDGVLLPELGRNIPSGDTFDQFFQINEPGSFEIRVNRIGFTGPNGPTTLTKRKTITAQFPGPPPTPEEPPQISVNFIESSQSLRFI